MKNAQLNSPSASILSLYSWFPMSHEVKKLLLSRPFPHPNLFCPRLSLPPVVASFIPSEAERRRIKREGGREGRAAMIRFLLIDPGDGKRSVMFLGHLNCSQQGHLRNLCSQWLCVRQQWKEGVTLMCAISRRKKRKGTEGARDDDDGAGALHCHYSGSAMHQV